MKIILLRHEERFNDPGFYTKLTDNGVINSLLLPNKFIVFFKSLLRLELCKSIRFLYFLILVKLYSNHRNALMRLHL